MNRIGVRYHANNENFIKFFTINSTEDDLEVTEYMKRIRDIPGINLASIDITDEDCVDTQYYTVL